MIVVYGVINGDGTHIDISNTLKGAKNYATRNGYTKVSKRVGYNAYEVACKIGKNWIDSFYLMIKGDIVKFNLETKRPIYKVSLYNLLDNIYTEVNLSSLEALELSQKYKAKAVRSFELKSGFKLIEFGDFF